MQTRSEILVTLSDELLDDLVSQAQAASRSPAMVDCQPRVRHDRNGRRALSWCEGRANSGRASTISTWRIQTAGGRMYANS